MLAWTLTLPASAVVSAAASWLAASGTVGLIVAALTGSAVAAGIYPASRRDAVSASNVNDVARPPAVDVAA